MFFEEFFKGAISSLLGVLNPGSRLYYIYLISPIFLAYFAYWQIERAHSAEARHEGEGVPERRTFLQYLFNPKIWGHPCVLQDAKFFVANSLLYYGLIVQFFIGTQAVSDGAFAQLVATFGPVGEPVMQGWLAITAYTLISVLVIDFAVFIMHYFLHKAPPLWEFHKVHHSADELNLLSQFRMHPVDLLTTTLTVTIFQAIAYAGFFYMTGSKPEIYTVLSINVVTFLFYVSGFHLRHSHIWLNYPVWLSKVLVSPAMHHIHHSADHKHWDKNMGLIFSFWDGVFKTRYIPVTHEKFKYGINEDEQNPFKSIWQMYLMPFVWSGQIVGSWLTTPRRRSVVYAGMLVTAVASLVTYKQYQAHLDTQGPGLPSLHLEELTWTEVDRALARGYRSIIIPTGGTEQNGPFVMLGKHNVVVRHTAEETANAVGKALVAPVMAYVPEGAVEPQPEGHMTYAGTLSLTDTVFEQVLEQTIRSLKVHGFSEFYLLGDSGSSQASQERVAKKLSDAWAARGLLVANLDGYYGQNGQKKWLLEQGNTEKDIGTHAGMRDASEVMALQRDGVRLIQRNVLPGRDAGSNGNPNKFSAKIGKKMLALKIGAAVKQIRELRAHRGRPASDEVAGLETR
ncbi:MAG: creatininase family protein [Rhizobiaceae bacterium]